MSNIAKFLAKGFRSAEIAASSKSVKLERETDPSGNPREEPDWLINAVQFAVHLRNAGIRVEEEAALWARWKLTSGPAAIRARADAVKMAALASDEFPHLGRFTPRGLKTCIRQSERKLRDYFSSREEDE